MVHMLPLLLTAFFAGLLGAGHCFGMCGGIAAGLGAMTRGRAAWRAALVFNLSRVCSYTLLGALAAGLVGLSGEAIRLPGWGRALRMLTALLILLVGLRLLLSWDALAFLEKAGARLWRRVAPLAAGAARVPGLSGRALLGLCWGLLPCGLVYTLLLTAASTGQAIPGAAVMLAFGMGTLPALLGLTLWAPTLAGLVQERRYRQLAGAGMVLLSGWAMWLAWLPSPDLHATH